MLQFFRKIFTKKEKPIDYTTYKITYTALRLFKGIDNQYDTEPPILK